MTTTAPTAPAAKKRGRETARDMVLSMGLMMLIVVAWYLLGRPDPANEAAIRPIDPTGQLAQLSASVPGVPVPTGLPAGWTATSATPEGDGLRVGYVTPGGEYAEYAARGAQPGTFLEDQTGRGTRTGTLTVGSRSFEVWSDEGGHTSLVLRKPGSIVVVGGFRETADDAEVQQLAGSLR